jgi:hypothetical protein
MFLWTSDPALEGDFARRHFKIPPLWNKPDGLEMKGSRAWPNLSSWASPGPCNIRNLHYQEAADLHC